MYPFKLIECVNKKAIPHFTETLHFVSCFANKQVAYLYFQSPYFLAEAVTLLWGGEVETLKTMYPCCAEITQSCIAAFRTNLLTAHKEIWYSLPQHGSCRAWFLLNSLKRNSPSVQFQSGGIRIRSFEFSKRSELPAFLSGPTGALWRFPGKL